MKFRILRRYTFELAPGEQLMIGGHNNYVTRHTDRLQYLLPGDDVNTQEWKDVEVVEENSPEPPAYRARREREEQRREALRNDPAFKRAAKMMADSIKKQTGKEPT